MIFAVLLQVVMFATEEHHKQRSVYMAVQATPVPEETETIAALVNATKDGLALTAVVRAPEQRFSKLNLMVVWNTSIYYEYIVW